MFIIERFNLKNICSTMLTFFTFMNRSAPHSSKRMRVMLLDETRECLLFPSKILVLSTSTLSLCIFLKCYFICSYLQIFTSKGVSLHELSIQIARAREFSVEQNDDLCSTCADGGNLLACNACPRSFHAGEVLLILYFFTIRSSVTTTMLLKIRGSINVT